MSPTNLLTSSLGKIRDTGLGALKDPKGTAGKALGQAKEAVSLGRSVVEGVVSQVRSRTTGRPRQAAPSAAAPAEPTAASAQKAAAKQEPAKKTPSKKAPSKKAPSKKAAVAEPALHGAQDEVVHTTETTGAPAAPGDPSPPPGEDTIIDPGTAKQVAKEAERGRRDAEPS